MNREDDSNLIARDSCESSLTSLERDINDIYTNASKSLEGFRGWAKIKFKDIALSLGENIKHDYVFEQIQQLSKDIDKTATNAQQADLMKAIIAEEQLHELPPFIESWIEQKYESFPPIIKDFINKFGAADSVGLSQIRVTLWAEKYQTTREELLDPVKHLKTMRRHLEFVNSAAENKGFDRNNIKINASMWNNMDVSGVTAYGERVSSYYNYFHSQRVNEDDVNTSTSQKHEDEHRVALKKQMDKDEETRQAQAINEKLQRNSEDEASRARALENEQKRKSEEKSREEENNNRQKQKEEETKREAEDERRKDEERKDRMIKEELLQQENERKKKEEENRERQRQIAIQIAQEEEARRQWQAYQQRQWEEQEQQRRQREEAAAWRKKEEEEQRRQWGEQEQRRRQDQERRRREDEDQRRQWEEQEQRRNQKRSKTSGGGGSTNENSNNKTDEDGKDKDYRLP